MLVKRFDLFVPVCLQVFVVARCWCSLVMCSASYGSLVTCPQSSTGRGFSSPLHSSHFHVQQRWRWVLCCAASCSTFQTPISFSLSLFRSPSSLFTRVSAHNDFQQQHRDNPRTNTRDSDFLATPHLLDILPELHIFTTRFLSDL